VRYGKWEREKKKIAEEIGKAVRFQLSDPNLNK
jgi:hypothetical protein